MCSAIRESDIRTVFTELRPLRHSSIAVSTSQLSVHHSIGESPSGLVTITGGRWSIYDGMAKGAIEQATSSGNRNSVAILRIPCISEDGRRKHRRVLFPFS
jgi:glycerol-3-phosphate dehydrogenase